MNGDLQKKELKEQEAPWRLEATHMSVTKIINFFILRTKINFKLNDQSLCAVNPVGQLAKACTHNKNLN